MVLQTLNCRLPLKKMLILASESPRRRELLSRLGVEFTVEPACVDELEEGNDLSLLPEKNALLKANAVAERFPEHFVLGADTGVFCCGRMLGKPGDDEKAKEMLAMLSGRTHQVISGTALVCRRRNISLAWSSVSQVTFKKLSCDEIARYISAVHVLDKAGAYAIQEHPELLGAVIEGELENIIGLPLAKLSGVLSGYGLMTRQ